MGPWTHGGWPNPFAGDVDFGLHSMLDDYNDLRCAWFDWRLKGMETMFTSAQPVRIFLMGSESGRADWISTAAKIPCRSAPARTSSPFKGSRLQQTWK